MNLVWRAERAEAAARYAAVVCLGTMLRRSLYSSRSSGEGDSRDGASISDAPLLISKALGSTLSETCFGAVFSAMEEDYYTRCDWRRVTLGQILATIGVDPDDRRPRTEF